MLNARASPVSSYARPTNGPYTAYHRRFPHRIRHSLFHVSTMNVAIVPAMFVVVYPQLSAEENLRQVIEVVAQARDDVTILDAPAVLPEVPALGAPDPRFAQFWPHRHGTDAIFLALLRRNDSGTAEGAG
jgi:hypothetical protein